MIQVYIDRFQENKNRLSEYLKTTPQSEYDTYKALLIKTIELCLNDSELYYDNFNINKITEIDDGDYQGTLLFLVPLDVYQPTEYDYITTYVGYGSCSGCDTLLGISNYSWDLPTDDQVNLYLILCLHMVEHMEWFRECPWER
jgi:hypothetical protein